jgi:preprotein translocase subunit SecG
MVGYTVLLILFIPVCLALVAIVLLQVGKGAGFAGAFGAGGGSQTVFGARAGNFLTKLTAWLAAMFMILALAMAWLSSKTGPGGGPKPALVEQSEQAEQPAAQPELPEEAEQPEQPEQPPAETE